MGRGKPVLGAGDERGASAAARRRRERRQARAPLVEHRDEDGEATRAASAPLTKGSNQAQITTGENASEYHRCISDGNGIYSIDKVRLELILPGYSLERLDSRMDTVQCDDARSYISRTKPGAYAIVWSLGFGSSGVTVGLGLVKPSGKADEHRGFMEFNPNKVANDRRFPLMLERLRKHGVKARLKRFDLAYDIPIPREWCSLVKDGRMYRCIVSKGITEYLGRKNKPGYVKLYDKARESHIEGRALTRLELTCDGSWNGEQITGKWPRVIHWSGEAPGKPITRVVALLLAEKSSRGESVEPYLHELHGTTRRKLVAVMPSVNIGIDAETAQALSNQARTWENLQVI